ncbi:SKA complex subunit 3 isoform X2 [Hemitrygon akajei]|uniref:SKA complex subunit 3 isoform X2 n=1 Tax=Hemitrygon akajei TaxID=2704970 RepID=UPI003BF993E2
MDVTANFFTKLKTLAVNLEKETTYLDNALNNDYDHEEAARTKMLHELHSEVRNIKADLHKKLETLETENRDNSALIRAFQTLHQKNTADLEEIEEHFQNYGYEPLHKNDQEPQMKLMETETELAANSETNLESQNDEVTTPTHEKPLLSDPTRTPQLEDFGLGHLMFRSAWGVQECPLPSDPKMTDGFSGNYDTQSSAFQGPVIPKTPKCTLQLGDDVLLTPKMENFEIDEHTGYVNDFTLALYNKRDQLNINSCNPLSTADNQPQKAHSLKDDFVHCMSHQSVLNDKLNSPLPPVFCTPGLKINKANHQVSVDENRKSNGSISSPVVPNFETPWLKRQSTLQHLKNEAYVQKEASGELDLKEPQLPAMSSFGFLNGYNKSPSPPPIMSNYEILLDTPKVPEMTTQIPSDVLKILSSYDTNRQKSNRENLTSFNLMTPVPRNKFVKENRM